MIAELESVRADIENSKALTRDDIQHMLPIGGARCALDCAFWDLATKSQSSSVWQLLDLKPRELYSVATIGIEEADVMAETARELGQYNSLKIKLDNHDPIGRLEAIRRARPDAKMIIDVNQGWSFEELKEYAPVVGELGIEMIEQPLARGGDEALEGYNSPVPLGADESCLGVAEYEQAARRYDVINIKLDKCGGLTEGLKIVEQARQDDKGLMIGNMSGSSLSMAPAFVIGQFCRFVDIDGPLFLVEDVDHGLQYGQGGIVKVPEQALWG